MPVIIQENVCNNKAGHKAETRHQLEGLSGGSSARTITWGLGLGECMHHRAVLGHEAVYASGVSL